MKKIFMVVVMACFAQTSFAAEYQVRPGDTLTKVAHHTGFTVAQLVQINSIFLPDLIFVGQKIKYFTNEDILDASRWCELRISQLVAVDINRQHFEGTLKDLQNRHFRFSVNEYSGTHVSNIFVYADAWRKLRQLSV